MIALGGFMQANTGSGTVPGDQTVSLGKNGCGQANAEHANWLLGDNADSFPAWVNRLLRAEAGVETDAAGRLDPKDSVLESEPVGMEQLQALITDAMAPSNPEHTAGEENIGAIEKALDSVAREIAPPEHTAAAENIGAIEKVLDSVAREIAPSINFQAQGDGQPDKQAQQSGPNLQPALSAATEQAHEINGQAAPKNPPERARFEHIAPRLPTNDGRPANDTMSAAKAKSTSSPEPVGRQMMPPDGNSIASNGNQSKGESVPSVKDRSLASQLQPEKNTETAPLPKESVIGPVSKSFSMATGQADQQAQPSQDDTANTADATRVNPAQRSDSVNVDDHEGHKSQSSESAKSAGAEHARPQAAFEESAKVILADKTPVAQAAELTRAEPSAAKGFQTTVMDQIVDKASLRTIQGRSEIQIRLKPDFLGNVQMTIATDKEQLMVRIVTDQPVVKEIIETNFHQLKTELQNQGLTIDKLEVIVNPDAEHPHNRDQFAQMFKQHDFSNGRRHHRGQDPEAMPQNEGNSNEDEQLDDDGINYFA